MQHKWHLKIVHHFTKCISKNDETTTDNEANLDLVMPMYNNVIECSLNYSKTTRRLQFYSKDEATNLNSGFSNDEILNLLNLRLIIGKYSSKWRNHLKCH